MRNIALCGLALLLIGMCASRTVAAAFATVDASAFDVESGTGNHDSQTGQTTASASYSNPEGGSASAFATIGSTTNGGLSMKVFATGTAGEVVSNRGSASLHWEDVIQTTGTLLDILIDFNFELSGSTSGDGSVSASLTTCVGGNCNTTVVTEPTTIHVTAPELISPSETVTISISLNAGASGIAIIGPSSSTADFSNSLNLVSITPRDVNGNFVPGVSFVSESGFDYNAVVVPEPTALALCALAMIAAIARPRERRLR